jgi:hypothetical protein
MQLGQTINFETQKAHELISFWVIPPPQAPNESIPASIVPKARRYESSRAVRKLKTEGARAMLL